jgi:hypothetical protein
MKKANLTSLWVQGLVMAAVVAAAVPVPDLAWAQLSTSVSASKTNVFNPLLNVLSYGCYTIGGFLGISGIMKLKAHTEAPTQGNLSHGIGRVSAAAGFLALPSVMGVLSSTSSQTLTGSNSFTPFNFGQ